jgi:hypothetical protein
MDKKYSGRETLSVDRLNCRQPYLVLLKYALDKKRRTYWHAKAAS